MRRFRIITARPLLGIELAIEHPRNVQNFDNQRCPDIRERDHDLPCISCGTFETVQWEAGHYRSRGKASHLRYNEDNIHKQCHHCNVQMSGNQQQYRIGLVEKIGAERVEALENNNTPHRYTIEELEGIRRHYSALRRALIKQREAA